MDILLRLIDPEVIPSKPNKHQVLTFGPTPLIVSGPQAMLMRWLKFFLTPNGSHPLRRNEGTGFYGLIRSDNSSLDRLQSVLGQEVELAAEQVRQNDRANFQRPANERLRTAAITQFVQLPPAGAEFWVSLSSVSGETIEALLPYASG